MKVLIVDDDESFCHYLKFILGKSSLGIEVEVVHDLDSAYATLGKSKFDCILLDYLLEKSVAVSLLDLMRKNGIGVPVIVVTAYQAQALIDEVKSAGAWGYISKADLSDDRLVNLVADAVEGKPGQWPDLNAEPLPSFTSEQNFVGMKVLIVDDVPQNIHVLRKTLESHNLTTFVASNGRLALDLVARVNPDLILLDVSMPEMDGYEVCRQLKANRETNEIPVIFVTAKTGNDDVIKGFSLGASDYIPKPFRFEEVLARVNAQLHLKKTLMEKQALLASQKTQIENRTAQLLEANARLQKEILRREVVENELKRAYQSVELQVEKQTAALVEANRLLRRGQMFFGAVVGDMVEGLITIDVSGIIKTSNVAAKGIFGYEESELVGKNVNMLMPEPYHSEHDQYVKNYLSSAIPRIIGTSREVSGKKKDGTVFPMELSVSEIQVEGEHFFIGLCRDISERKLAEQKLIMAKEEAERSSQIKTLFLSNMSHELRTPLNSILGFAELLQMAGDLTELQNENLTRIMKSGKHLLAIINDILNLARIESGKTSVNMETVDVNAMINEVTYTVAPIAERSQIKLNANTDKDGQLFVLADEVRLKQVLLNLVSNAIKYNREQGAVSIFAHKISDQKVRISVADTGLGIKEEHFISVFEPFNRLGAETGEKEGTGIGLAISKGLVELMGGEIFFESKYGEGSTFYLDLMIVEQTPLSNDNSVYTSESNPTSNLESFTVVYIEDNFDNVEIVRQVFNARPHIKYYYSLEPLGGIEIVKSQKPDLILLDINLPGMDGFQVLEQLRKLDSVQHTPIIAMSANAMPDFIEKALSLGFNEYIPKPFNIPKLLETVDRHARNKIQSGR